MVNIWLLVTGTWLDYDFPETVGNGIIIPTDELIFFRGVGIPPTSMDYQYIRPYRVVIFTYIGLFFGLIYGIGTSILGSWNSHWCYGLPWIYCQAVAHAELHRLVHLDAALRPSSWAAERPPFWSFHQRFVNKNGPFKDHFWPGFHCHLLHFFASIFAFACFQRFFSNLFSCGTLSVSLITVQTLHEGSPVQTGQSWNHGYLQVFCVFANLDFVSYWYCNLLDLDVIQALSYADSEKLW